MSAKIYLIILKTGIYLSLLSVFLVFNNLLFPFITSKQLFFNILIEILVVIWLALIIKYPEFRPKKSLISYGLIGFFAAVLLSCIFSVDFNLSFWGDIERMLGFFHILHFLFLYFIIIIVFRDFKDWRNLFLASVTAAILISYDSIFRTAFATIGNTAYVSGYIIFNIYFALILFFNWRESEQKNRYNWLINLLFLAAILIMLSVMKVTHTRGAYVGLAVSFFILFLLVVVLAGSKKVKIYSLTAIAVMFILIPLVFIYSKSNLVQNNSILRTITQISAKTPTFQTRLISWQTAFRDFPHHPLLGTGWGNFAITFDKYFDPKFYSYTTGETYFDRAHNNLIEIMSTSGLLGLLAYLSIFVVAYYYLIKGLKRGQIKVPDFILLTCLIIGYFIQNLVVFDSLVTYLALMITLAYIYWLSNKDEVVEYTSKELDNKEIITWLAAGLIMLVIIFQYNIKPWLMLDETIKGQLAFSRGDTLAGIEAYQKAESYNTVLNRDSRSSLINLISANPTILSKLDNNKAKEALDFMIKMAEANVTYNPHDSMMQMQLANILNTASIFYTDNASQFYYYSDRSLEAIDKSIAASPGRVTIYFTKAQIHITRNEKDKAIETLKDALALNPGYNEPRCLLAKVYIYYSQLAEGYQVMDQCLDMGGSGSLAPADFVKTLINFYSDKKDYPRLIKLYEKLTSLESDAKIWVNLARLYADQGQTDQAITAANKASELDPTLKSASEEFISKLKK